MRGNSWEFLYKRTKPLVNCISNRASEEMVASSLKIFQFFVFNIHARAVAPLACRQELCNCNNFGYSYFGSHS